MQTIFRRTLFATTTAVLLVAIYIQANAAALSNRVLVRVISATWCPPCQALKKGLKAEKILTVEANHVASGKMIININGEDVVADVQDLEVDVMDEKQLAAVTPKVISDVDAYPTTQIYLDGKLVKQGFHWDLMKASGGNATTTVEALKQAAVGVLK